MACQPCVWKYGDAFKRHEYRRDPEFVGLARCDFCKQEDRRLWLYFAAEKFMGLRSTQEARRADFLKGAIVVSGGWAFHSDRNGNVRRENLWKS